MENRPPKYGADKVISSDATSRNMSAMEGESFTYVYNLSGKYTPTDNSSGEDSISCEGTCDSWVCKDTKKVFESTKLSDKPFSNLFVV